VKSQGLGLCIFWVPGCGGGGGLVRGGTGDTGSFLMGSRFSVFFVRVGAYGDGAQFGARVRGLGLVGRLAWFGFFGGGG